MSILHVLPSLDQNYGGPLRLVLDLSARARQFGQESEILGVGDPRLPDNPFPAELVHSVALARPAAYRYSVQLEPWLRANLKRFEGVVLHGLWVYPGRVVSRVCASQAKPFACFLHGMLEPWSVYGQGGSKALKKLVYWALWERRVVRRARAVFYTTERERRLVSTRFSIRNPSYIVVPYGVDASAPKVSSPENQSLAQPVGIRVALFLGRVHPKKNLGFLLEAWARARPGPEWRLQIAGPFSSDNYASELRRLVARYQLENQVSFLGPVSGADKSYLLQRADWFVLPSKQENFGVAVLEAIAAGCPVAVSDQVYLADYFHPQAEVLPLRMEDWISFFRERMPDESHRHRLIALDRQHIIPQFEINSVAKAWAQRLQSVLGA